MDNILILRDSNDRSWNDILVFPMTLMPSDVEKIEKIIQKIQDTVEDYTIDDIVEEIKKHYKHITWYCNGDIKVLEY